MKRVNNIWIIILFMLAGCGGGGKSGNIGINANEIMSESAINFEETPITVDVIANYPKKELKLQDFMDVEYIPLETSREFVCQGRVRAIGEKFIVVMNEIVDGDIFIFDRNGKGLRKINRRGNGPEEYLDALPSNVLLDEDNDELIIYDHYTRKIIVYDLYGKFKRSFRHKEGFFYGSLYNFNTDYLICNQAFYDDGDRNGIVIISKHNGNVIKDIEIPYEQLKTTSMRIPMGQRFGIASIDGPTARTIIPHHGNWILVEISSDTIFRYLPDHNMTPFIVRTPSVQSMNPEVFLYPALLTDRYYFMKAVKKEFDIKTRQGFPSKDLMYDRQEKKLFEYTVYNDDFSYKGPVNFGRSASTDEIAFCQKIEADDLFDAYKEGQLKGKLKEIAAGLKEEDNPVLMLVKHKK